MSAPFEYKGGTFPGTGGTCGTSLAQGESCSVVVTINSNTIGVKTSTLTINYDNGSITTSTSISLQATVLGRDLQGKFVPSGGPTERNIKEEFGKATALDGSTLAVGVPLHDFDTNLTSGVDGSGAVYIYTRIGSSWTLQQKLTPTQRNRMQYFGSAVSLHGNSLIVGAPGEEVSDGSGGTYSDAGAAYVYVRSSGVWTLEQKLLPQGTNSAAASDLFGTAVSIYSDTVAVGAINNGYDASGGTYTNDAGAVFVYTRTSGTWSFQQKIVATGTNARMASDYFGKALSLSGNTLAVGSDNGYDDSGGGALVSDAGAVYIFTRSGSTWSLQQKLVGTGTNGRLSGDEFGSALSLDGDTIAIGAWKQNYDENGAGNTSDAGAVYVFKRSAGVWSIEQKIVASGSNGRVASDNFGYPISLSGDSLAVGALKQDYDASGNNSVSSAGAAFVYTRSGATWSLQQRIAAQGTNSRQENDSFGVVALSGDLLAVGAYGHSYDENGANYVETAGVAYALSRSGGVWSQEDIVVAGTRSAAGRVLQQGYGTSVAVYQDTLAIGAPWDECDADGLNCIWKAGAAYVYLRSGSSWTLQQKVVPSGTNARTKENSFGSSVALEGDTLVVGSPEHDFDQNGANQEVYAGAVFVFARSGGTWTQQGRFSTPSNRGSWEYFGASVALSGNTIVVGAPNVPTDASGLNSLSDAGAAFVFVRSGTTWSFQQKLAAPSASNGRKSTDEFGTSVAVSGDTIAVGAPQHDWDASGANSLGDAGAVYVYTRSAGVWSFAVKHVGQGTNGRVANDEFGTAVSISGTTLAVGAPYQSYDASGGNSVSSAGAVYLYSPLTSGAATVQKIVAVGTNARQVGDHCGTSVSLYQDTLLMGCPDHNADVDGVYDGITAGAAFLFERVSSVWTFQQKFTGLGTNGRVDSDYFGQSVSVYGATVVIGAPNHSYDADGDNFHWNAGAVSVFR